MSMDLKSFRQYDEHDVVNLYSTVEGALTKGSLVEFVTADPDNHNGFGDTLDNVPDYAVSSDYVVNWKVQAATSGTKNVAGILLKEVVTTINDPWAVDARFVDEVKLAEKQVVPTGRAVPFATRGIFEVIGIDTSAGRAGPGSGAYVSNSGAGIIAVGNPSNTGEARTRVGTFLSSKSATHGGVFLKLGVSY